MDLSILLNACSVNRPLLYLKNISGNLDCVASHALFTWLPPPHPRTPNSCLDLICRNQNSLLAIAYEEARPTSLQLRLRYKWEGGSWSSLLKPETDFLGIGEAEDSTKWQVSQDFWKPSRSGVRFWFVFWGGIGYRSSLVGSWRGRQWWWWIQVSVCTLLLLSFEDLYFGGKSESASKPSVFSPQNHQNPRFVGCDGGLCACELSKVVRWCWPWGDSQIQNCCILCVSWTEGMEICWWCRWGGATAGYGPIPNFVSPAQQFSHLIEAGKSDPISGSIRISSSYIHSYAIDPSL